MASKNKTVAEIVREMVEFGNHCAAWIALCAFACGAIVAFLANCPKEDNGGCIEPNEGK